MRGGRWGVGVLLAPLVLVLVAVTPVRAANDHVTNCNNSGAGSLPVVVANAAVGDTVVFDQDCTGSTAITLTIGTGPINVTKNLTIDGTGHTVTVDGGNAVRGFIISGAVNVTLKGLTIQHGNAGAGGGGGIESAGSVTLYVINSAITHSVGILGGGIYNLGVLQMASSTVSSNSTTNGGGGGAGIYNFNTLAATNSTITGNLNGSGQNGGGIFNIGTLTLTNSTLTGNSAVVAGGIVNGVAGAVTLTNTLVAGNSDIGGNPDIGGPISSGGHNLIGNTTGNGPWIASDVTNVSANLGLLTSNGGPTQTIAPLAGSPAIGAGDATVCANTAGNIPVGALDQRGLPRLHSVCDIGAYQVQSHLALTPFGGAAGAFVGIGVAVLDDYSNFVAAYGGTIHFSTTDALATPPADYTFTGSGGGKDNGTHTSPAIFRTAGIQTVTATDMQLASVAGGAIGAIAPTVSSVSPPSGGTAGGNHVTLTGIGFGTNIATVSVAIGGAPAAVTNAANTQLIIVVPAHALGVVDVTVTVSGQSATVPGGYTYGTVNLLPPPNQPGGPPGSPILLPAPQSPGPPQGGVVNPLPPPRP